MIPLVGGIGLGLVWGWLLALRLAGRRDTAAALWGAAAAASLAGEAAMLAGRGSAIAVIAASGVGALLQTGLSRAVTRRGASA